MADVAQIDAVARLDADREIVQLLDVVDHHVGVEQDLVVAEIGDAGRHHHVALLEGLDDVEHRQVAGLQLLRDRGRRGRCGPCRRPPPERRSPGTAPSMLRTSMRATSLTLASSRYGFSTVSTPSGMVAGRDRTAAPRAAACWAARSAACRGPAELVMVRAAVGIDVVAEIDSDDADAGNRFGFDQAGPGRLVDPALDAVGDRLLDRGGRHALVIGDHLDGRGLEHRQDVDRDPRQSEDAQDDDHEDDRGDHVRVSERRLDQPHDEPPCVESSFRNSGRTRHGFLGHGEEARILSTCGHRGGRHGFDHQGIIPDGMADSPSRAGSRPGAIPAAREAFLAASLPGPPAPSPRANPHQGSGPPRSGGGARRCKPARS